MLILSNQTRSPKVLARRADADVGRVEQLAVGSAKRALVAMRRMAINSLQYHTCFSARSIVNAQLVPILTKASTVMHTVGERRSLLLMKQATTAAQRQQALADARHPWSGPTYLAKNVLGDVTKLVNKILSPNIDQIAQQYGPGIQSILDKFSDSLDEKVSDKVNELIMKGLPTSTAVEQLQDRLDELGINGVGSGQLETIFRTQLQSSFSAGRWIADQDPDIQDILWGYTYVTAGDDRVRESHAVLDGVTLPKDDEFWNTWWPPNGWNCRCQVIPVFDKREEVPPPDGIGLPDDGFGTNPGQDVGIAPSIALALGRAFSIDWQMPVLQLAYNPDQPRDEKGRWIDAGGVGSSSIPFYNSLTKVKSLGGTTGAVLMKDSSGNEYVVKGGASEAHVKSEHLANETYRAMGVRAPASLLRVNENDKWVMVAKKIEGTPLNELTGQARKDAEDKIREHFVADALLANWDVVGQDADNIIVDDKGNPWRVDNGGSLSFRAQGASKGAQWNGNVQMTIDSMKSSTNQGGKIFSKVTNDEIKSQAQAILEKRDQITSVNKDPVLKLRLDKLEELYGSKTPAPITPLAVAPESPAAVKPVVANGFHSKSLDDKIAHLKIALAGQKFNPVQLKKIALLNDDPNKLLIPSSFTPPQIDAVKAMFPGVAPKYVVASKALRSKMAELGVASAHELWHGAKVTQGEKDIAIKTAATPAEKKAAQKLEVTATLPATFAPSKGYENDPKFERVKLENGGELESKTESGNYKAINHFWSQFKHSSKYISGLAEEKVKEVVGATGLTKIKSWCSSASQMRRLENDEPNNAGVKAFHKGLDACPKFEGITYRGVSHIKPGTEIYQALQTPGSTVKLLSSACSSRQVSTAASFATGTCLLRIAGRTGASIEDIGGFKSEHEVVLRKGATYKVVGVAHDVKAKTYGNKIATFIDLEEIEDTPGAKEVKLSFELQLSKQKPDERLSRFTEDDPATYLEVCWSDEALFADEDN